jgi:hypothetical protein
MTRPVTSDHILFDECLDSLRYRNDPNADELGAGRSYLITSFQLKQEWDIGICIVPPSITIRLPGGNSAFICTVNTPKWVENGQSHFFGIALSAVISFITGTGCKSTRYDYLSRHPNLSDDNRLRLALINPILTAGPGATRTSLSSEWETSIGREVKELIDLLNRIDYKKYVIAMQSIRMIQLSLINKRDDFGLAYLLVVSAIEAIAQKVIARDDVKPKEPYEEVWKEKAKVDLVFAHLYRTYKSARGENGYLKQRYIKFILDYAPFSSWEEYARFPSWEEYYDGNNFGINNLFIKDWYKITPRDFPPEEIDKILKDTYNHRSSFVHAGKQPPHREPLPYENRFFSNILGRKKISSYANNFIKLRYIAWDIKVFVNRLA